VIKHSLIKKILPILNTIKNSLIWGRKCKKKYENDFGKIHQSTNIRSDGLKISINEWKNSKKKYKTSGSNKEVISEQKNGAIGSSFEWDFKIIFMKNIS